MIPKDWKEDKLREECGVFGVFSNKEVDTYILSKFGLFSLQHRGQEGAGIATLSQQGRIKIKKGAGLVAEVFDKSANSEFMGYASIGHVRYYTTEGTKSYNTRLLYIADENKNITLALVQNGNPVNTEILKAKLEDEGYSMLTSSDSELIFKSIYRYCKQKMSLEEATEKTCREIEGAFSFLIMSQDTLIAVRDAHAIRPLCLGKTKDEVFVFSSETCGLNAVHAEFEQDINAGEMMILEKNHPLRSLTYTPSIDKKNLLI